MKTKYYQWWSKQTFSWASNKPVSFHDGPMQWKKSNASNRARLQRLSQNDAALMSPSTETAQLTKRTSRHR